MYQIFQTFSMKSGRLVAPSGRTVVIMDGEVALSNPAEIAWMQKEIACGSFPFTHVGEREEFKQDPLATIRAQLRCELEKEILVKLGDMGVQLPEQLRPTSTTDILSVTENGAVGQTTISAEELKAKLAALAS